MSVTERIFSELAKQGKTMANLCDYLGIKSNVVANWKASASIPPGKYLLNISEYLGVSLDYLFTGKESLTPLRRYHLKWKRPQARMTQPDTADTRELLKVYSQLDHEGRTMVTATAYQELRRANEELEEKNKSRWKSSMVPRNTDKDKSIDDKKAL